VCNIKSLTELAKAIKTKETTNMNTHKRLVESVMDDAQFKDSGVNAFLKSIKYMNHLFVERWNENFAKMGAEGFKQWQKENLTEGEIEMGALRGQTVGDSTGVPAPGAGNAGGYLQVYPTMEIFNAVVRGFTRYMDDSFVKKYTTENVVFKVPKTEYQELAGPISSGQLPHTEKTIDYVTVDLSSPESEKGGKVTWTRSLLEDITFDVQAEMAEGLGHAIAYMMMKDILVNSYTTTPYLPPHVSGGPTTITQGGLGAVPASGMPRGSIIQINNPILWTDFLAVVGAVDIGIAQSDGSTKTYGPPDYVLVSTDIYWQLLNIIQMTNVLYEGSTDPVNRGAIKLALGCTILKQSVLPAGTIYALNSQKAIALVTRRTLKIEPVLFPVWDEYGFIGTVRYGVTPIFNAAVQKGSFSGS
jgi:hypothetical protein